MGDQVIIIITHVIQIYFTGCDLTKIFHCNYSNHCFGADSIGISLAFLSKVGNKYAHASRQLRPCLRMIESKSWLYIVCCDRVHVYHLNIIAWAV